jgi:cell division protein YceG involved in septum cleavage
VHPDARAVRAPSPVQAIAGFLLVGVVGLAVGFTVLHVEARRFAGTPGAPVAARVTIAPGTTTHAIVDQLVDAGVLSSSRPARWYVRYVRREEPFHPGGSYMLAGALTPREVFDQLYGAR